MVDILAGGGGSDSGGLSDGIVGGGGAGSSYWGHPGVTYIADVGGDDGSTTAQGGATSSTFNGGNGFIAIQYTRQLYYNDFGCITDYNSSGVDAILRDDNSILVIRGRSNVDGRRPVPFPSA